MANFRESAATWTDFAEALAAWEDDFGVDILVELRTYTQRGRVDLFADIKTFDRSEESGRPLHETRQGLNIRRIGAPLRNMLYGVFSHLEQLDSSPWLWPRKMRRERVQLD